MVAMILARTSFPGLRSGLAFAAGFDLTRLGKDYDLSTFDTFATACHVLSLPLPEGLDGQPVTGAEEVELLQPTPATKPAEKPAASTQPVGLLPGR